MENFIIQEIGKTIEMQVCSSNRKLLILDTIHSIPEEIFPISTGNEPKKAIVIDEIKNSIENKIDKLILKRHF